MMAIPQVQTSNSRASHGSLIVYQASISNLSSPIFIAILMAKVRSASLPNFLSQPEKSPLFLTISLFNTDTIADLASMHKGFFHIFSCD